MTKIEQEARALITSLGFSIEEDDGATTIVYTDHGDDEEYHFLIQTFDYDEERTVRGKRLTDQWRDALVLFTEIARDRA